ncbi:MAG: hypothetical protein R3267_11885, partial [Paenisporosarcina sp.]|nr:hypothetical protein [Paenisporosarcina sp.]
MSTITWFLVYALVGFLTGSFVDAHRNNNVLKWPKRVENGVDLCLFVTAILISINGLMFVIFYPKIFKPEFN